MVLKAAQSVGIPTEDDRTELTTKYVDQDQEQIVTDIQAWRYQINIYT